MNKTSWTIINFTTFYFLVLFSAAIQTSLFHSILGWRPTVQLALVFIVYICLTRSSFESFLFIILSCYTIGLLSVMEKSICVFSGTCIFLVIQTLKTRVYSSSHVYFAWTALGAVFGFHLISWITSVFFIRAVAPRPWDWIVEVLLTSLFVRMAYTFCLFVDKKTKRLSLSELNS
jgi:hypothetical protein